MQVDPQVAVVAFALIFLLGGIWAIGRGIRSDVREIVRDEVAPMRETQRVHGEEIEKLRAAKSDTYQRLARGGL